MSNLKETSKKRAVLITGASGGIGKASVKLLHEHGFLVLASVRTQEDGNWLKTNISEGIQPLLMDITKPDSLRSAAIKADEILRGYSYVSGLYGLVNNAGIIINGPLEMVSIDSLRKQFEVNVIGQVAVTQTFLPLIRRGPGRIINIGAVTGRITIPFMGPISASKTAMESVTDAMRGELGLWDIPVSLIQPAAMKTEIFSKAAREAKGAFRSTMADVKHHYSEILKTIDAAIEKQGGDEPKIVAKAILRALTDKHPKTRYPAGKGASLMVKLRFLPDRLKDKIFLQQIGVSKELIR